MVSTTWLKPPASRLLKSGHTTLNPGEEVGWHETTGKEEVIIVLRGHATVLEGETKTVLSAGHAHFIPRDVRHNVVNEHKEILEYYYVVGLLQ